MGLLACVDVLFRLHICVINFGIMAENMDVCSLEDYKCSQLFITQEAKDNCGNLLSENCENMDTNDDVFLGNSSSDFRSPCVSMLSKDSIYSDISDDEDFQLPSSQVGNRYVYSLVIILCYCKYL